jgi:hypothetical protein
VAILFNPETAAGEGSFYARPIQAAASTLAIESTLASAGDATGIEDALVTLSRDADSGLIVMPDIFTTRAFPEKTESGDSHPLANLIQASYWREASMDGKALFGRLAQTSG